MRTLAATALALAYLTSAALAASDEDAIRAPDRAFEDAFNRGDSAALAGLYTPDAAAFPPGDAPRADGLAAIGEVWRAVIASGLKDLALRPDEIVVLDGTAYATGTGTFTMPSADGGTRRGSLKYVEIWRRGEDGAWRLHRDIWN